MVKIQPVTYPIHGDAIYLHCLVLNFPTNAIDCGIYYELLREDFYKLGMGNIQLTPEEFTAWGEDNRYIDELIAGKLNLTIVNEPIPIIDNLINNIQDASDN